MIQATRYAPPELGPDIDLDLSKNEAPADSASALTDASLPPALLSSYPDTRRLTEAIARRHGVSNDRVLVTAGADDALLRCFLAFCGAGGAVAATRPTFEMIEVYATQVGGLLHSVDWWDDPFPVDPLVATARDAALTIVASPNNPTGSAIDRTQLGAVAAQVPLLVLDAAYEEFADEPLTEVALDHDNVIVLRTLSKAWGLAGLRVGYAVGAPELISTLRSFGSPYSVSGVSAHLAASRLEDSGGTSAYVSAVREQRTALTDVLLGLGMEVLPSQGNFVLARFPNAEFVASVAGALGIGLRRFPGRPGLESHLRMTVPGTKPEMRRLVHALHSALEPDALLFDLDGVLADVSESQTQAIIAAAADLGADVGPKDVHAAKEAGNANDDWKLTRRLCSLAGIEVPLSEATARFEFHYQGSDGRPGLKDAESLTVDPALLHVWAERMPIAVVTGRPRRDAGEFLDRFGISDLVSAVVTRDDAPMKPDPTPVRLAMKHLGVERAWMLGDTPDDVSAALGAGAVPIGVIAPGDDPERARVALTGAASTLDHVEDLNGLLR